MRHQGLIRLITATAAFRSLQAGVELRQSQQVYGLAGSQLTLWLAGLLQETGRPLLVVTPGLEEARRITMDLSAFLPEEEVGFLPPAEVMPYEVYARSLDLAVQRLTVMESLLAGRIRVLAMPAAAAVQPMTPPEAWRKAIFHLAAGQQVTWEDLLHRLDALGYQRSEVVEVPGQVSVRGGIVDIFPLTMDQPVRVEFFDDEVDSIRTFDPRSQRSLEALPEIAVTPVRELLLTPEALERGKAALQREYQTQLKRLEKQGRGEAARHLEEKVAGYLEQLETGAFGTGLEQFRHLFYPQAPTILEYFPAPPLVVMDEPGRIKETMVQAAGEMAEMFGQLLAAGAALPSQAENPPDYDHLLKLFFRGRPLICFSLLPKQFPGISPMNIVGVTAKTMHPFLGKTNMLAEEVKNWRHSRYSVVLFAGNQERAQLIKDALWDQGVEAPVTEDLSGQLYPGQVMITLGTLQKGFEFPQWKLVAVSDAEVFGRQKRPRPRKSFKEGTRIAAFTDLKVGDFVVHVQHGIGRYRGIEQLEVGGVQKDYLLVQYSGEDRLYVPTDQVSMIQKYVGAEGHVPKLNRLGGNEWARAKKRVQESVEAMAEELLALYAAREAMPGYAFSPDTVWQRDFEASFPYTETPDQLQAIAEVKRDMEARRPMDRLLCGDVGYGKTEVALRAAFKAVMDGKQVAVLVPTTILAQQHYQTFQERMAAFPVSVAVLSRFRSAKQQEQTVKGLRAGAVDIVIGTHRLLSQDVKFKNLGLVIVDEEQRFGVAHKEKLKQLSKNVDVLTLTATPIPRTLHMSMVGVRDMSLIETPPEDRFPVQTYVVEYSPELVREAIRREMSRGGQVYFVHNRVMDIDRITRHLQELLPDARIGVAHGQMREDQLERVMLDFMEGNYDVLVCTSIVENGLDISNVNTLIVHEADHFGLSQLYQLRGRVGRTNRLAYAYFTYRRDRVLGEAAEKRLAAIREFTEFGSGFKIAMRDLEIRGAGNILGPEQHGHMLSVGFDLYCQLMEEAVQKLRARTGEPAGEAAPEPTGPTIELNVDAYISDAYIPQAALKMEVYQRMMAVESMADVEQLEEEVFDRFGELPPVVKNLMHLARLKVLAQEVHVTRVEHKKGEVHLVFGPDHGLKGEKLMQLAGAFPRRLSFSVAGGLTIAARVAGMSQADLLILVESIFKRIKLLAAARTG
ncbi:transcription-repair coupling factor [Clostridiales bacterium PH28_bin88]|nr:transcription-repair coupling factor [Clostridiales bacterium PH28_bin88]